MANALFAWLRVNYVVISYSIINRNHKQLHIQQIGTGVPDRLQLASYVYDTSPTCISTCDTYKIL